jgi:hypothetical protein
VYKVLPEPLSLSGSQASLRPSSLVWSVVDALCQGEGENPSLSGDNIKVNKGVGECICG